jgi:hypothetical protein
MAILSKNEKMREGKKKGDVPLGGLWNVEKASIYNSCILFVSARRKKDLKCSGNAPVTIQERILTTSF